MNVVYISATWAIVAGALTCGLVMAAFAAVVIYKCVTSRRRQPPLSKAIHRNASTPNTSIILTTPKKYRSGSAPIIIQSQTAIRNTSPAPILPNETHDMTVPRKPLSRASTIDKPIDVNTIQTDVYTVNETKPRRSSSVEVESCVDGEKVSLGSLHFAVGYDGEKSVLTVSILKLCDLPARSNQDTTDPYVKLQLLPDRKQKVKTRVLRKTLNPVYDETFTFYDVDFAQLTSLTLHFVVLSFDRFSRDDVIGEITFPIYSIEQLTFDGRMVAMQEDVVPRLIKVGSTPPPFLPLPALYATPRPSSVSGK